VIVDGKIDNLVEADVFDALEQRVLDRTQEIARAPFGQFVGTVDDQVLRLGPVIAELLDCMLGYREGRVVFQQAGR
jgi:hypothetical protein